MFHGTCSNFPNHLRFHLCWDAGLLELLHFAVINDLLRMRHLISKFTFSEKLYKISPSLGLTVGLTWGIFVLLILTTTTTSAIKLTFPQFHLFTSFVPSSIFVCNTRLEQCLDHFVTMSQTLNFEG